MSITPGVEGLRFRQLVDFLHRSQCGGKKRLRVISEPARYFAALFISLNPTRCRQEKGYQHRVYAT